MDLSYFLKAVFLGLIEGITEFLPISSTGHVILVGDWISFESNDAKVFEVVIQLGAILAVCWLYREKIIGLLRGLVNGNEAERRFALCVIVAFLPAALLGALFISFIKSALFNPTVVATALIVGGFIILAVENRKTPPHIHDTKDMGWRQALNIGLAQCVAMIPGTSRSGATIVGGMLSGLSRKTATEFSFFLAMPTMIGAASYDLFKHHHLLTRDDIGAIVVGFIAAFVSALWVVSALVRFIANHSLRVFAWYRIALGLVIFAWMV